MTELFGTFGLTVKDQKAVVLEVVAEAVEVRQGAYDATMDILGETVPPEQAREMLSLITDQGFAGLQARFPDLAKNIMQEMRRNA